MCVYILFRYICVIKLTGKPCLKKQANWCNVWNVSPLEVNLVFL